jgi:hypothetical protein
VCIEGVVEVTVDPSKVEPQSGDTGTRVGRARSGEKRQHADGILDLSREDVDVQSVLEPPRLLAPDVALGRCGEADAARSQDDFSSLRISSASTSRSVATSISDWRSAAWRAARSASSSQSPGSSGSRSTSVPSGRSVGSSTTSRPARTRALSVISRTVEPGSLPNKPLEQAGGRALRDHRTPEAAGRSTAGSARRYRHAKIG